MSDERLRALGRAVASGAWADWSALMVERQRLGRPALDSEAEALACLATWVAAGRPDPEPGVQRPRDPLTERPIPGDVVETCRLKAEPFVRYVVRGRDADAMAWRVVHDGPPITWVRGYRLHPLPSLGVALGRIEPLLAPGDPPRFVVQGPMGGEFSHAASAWRQAQRKADHEEGPTGADGAPRPYRSWRLASWVAALRGGLVLRLAAPWLHTPPPEPDPVTWERLPAGRLRRGAVRRAMLMRPLCSRCCAGGGSMSLDVYLTVPPTEPETVHHDNVTHNLTAMAAAAGLYDALWRPEEIRVTKAKELAPLLEKGLAKLQGDPAMFQAFNPASEGVIRWALGDA